MDKAHEKTRETEIDNGVRPSWATSLDPLQLEYGSLSFLLQRCWDLLTSIYIRDTFSFHEDSIRHITLMTLSIHQEG
jgi:hypothetical protein